MKGIRNMTNNRSRRQRGFSIVEMMVGIALGLVILAALTSFFVNTSANRNEIERTSRQIENGRYAIDTVRGSLRVTAFYAELQQAGLLLSNPDPCLPLKADLAFDYNRVPIAVYGYAADSPAFPGCIVDRLADTDVLVMRRFNTEMVTTAQAATPEYSNQLFVQLSRCGSDSTDKPWMMDYGGNTGSFSQPDAGRNTKCNGPNDLYQYRVEIYYVRSWSVTPGDNIPTLVRVDIDNKTMRSSPIVEGIRGFRVSYGIDNAPDPLGDGTPDQWRRCDVVQPCGTCDATSNCFYKPTDPTSPLWSRVTMLRVTILAENLEDSPGYTDNHTYTLDGFSVPAFGDHRKRHVYSTMVTMPNRTGPLEN